MFNKRRKGFMLFTPRGVRFRVKLNGALEVYPIKRDGALDLHVKHIPKIYLLRYLRG